MLTLHRAKNHWRHIRKLQPASIFCTNIYRKKNTYTGGIRHATLPEMWIEEVSGGEADTSTRADGKADAGTLSGRHEHKPIFQPEEIDPLHFRSL